MIEKLLDEPYISNWCFLNSKNSKIVIELSNSDLESEMMFILSGEFSIRFSEDLPEEATKKYFLEKIYEFEELVLDQIYQRGLFLFQLKNEDYMSLTDRFAQLRPDEKLDFFNLASYKSNRNVCLLIDLFKKMNATDDAEMKKLLDNFKA